MRWKTAEFRKKHVISEESYQKIRLKTDFEKFPLRPLTGGNFHVKVKAVIRLTEVEMTTGSIA